MGGFWETMPVVVDNYEYEDTYTNVVDKEYLLKKIDIELKKRHLEFDYTIYDTMDEQEIIHMKNFFDKFYSGIIYGVDIFKYFLKDALVIKFTSNNQVIGYIVGKKIQLCVKEKLIDTMEVSFLCIIPEYRKKHLTPYMINLLLQEFINRYDIITSIYIISTKINSSAFCVKNSIHRPLNLDNLIKCNFIPEEYNNKEIYNSFDIDTGDTLLYITTVPNNQLINILLNNINDFQKKHFDIYRVYDITDIELLFTMNNFHKFLILDSNKQIKSFICLFDFDIQIGQNTSYKSSSMHMMYFKNYTKESIKTTFELLSQYCFNNKILDVLSFLDIFPINNYDELKCLVGKFKTSYYLFNNYMTYITPDKNIFTTI